MPCKNRRCEDVISSDSLRVPGAISPHPTTYHPLLTSSSSLGHVHLIAGNNTLASVRCRKSIEAGAKVVVVAPAEESAIYVGGLHPGLISLVGEDKISWVNKKLQQEDLVALGRPEVDNVVDLVWGTSGVEDHGVFFFNFNFSKNENDEKCLYRVGGQQIRRFLPGVNVYAFPSTSSTVQLSVHSLCSLRTAMAHFTLVSPLPEIVASLEAE
jgi:hypothetical protein